MTARGVLPRGPVTVLLRPGHERENSSPDTGMGANPRGISVEILMYVSAARCHGGTMTTIGRSAVQQPSPGVTVVDTSVGRGAVS